jgi:hypothetical protein
MSTTRLVGSAGKNTEPSVKRLVLVF